MAGTPTPATVVLRYQGSTLNVQVDLTGTLEANLPSIRKAVLRAYGRVPRLYCSGVRVQGSDVLRAVGVTDGCTLQAYLPCSLSYCPYPSLTNQAPGIHALSRRMYAEYLTAMIPRPGIAPVLADMEPVTGWKSDPAEFLAWHRAQPSPTTYIWPNVSVAERNAMQESWAKNDLRNWFVSLHCSPPGLPCGSLLLFVELPKEYPFKPPAVQLLTRLTHPIVDVLSTKPEGRLSYVPGLAREEWSPDQTVIRWGASLVELMAYIWDDDWREKAEMSLIPQSQLLQKRADFEATFRVYCARNWTPSAHRACSQKMRRAARLTLLLHKRRECLLSSLPKDLVLLIIQFIVGSLSVDDSNKRRTEMKAMLLPKP